MIMEIVEILKHWNFNRQLKKTFHAISLNIIKLSENNPAIQFQKSAKELYINYGGCFVKVKIIKNYHVKWSIGITNEGVSPLYYRDCLNEIIIRQILPNYPHPDCVGTSSDAHYYNDVQSAVDLFNKFIDLVKIFQAMRKERDDVAVKLAKNQKEAEGAFEKKVDTYISSSSLSNSEAGAG